MGALPALCRDPEDSRGWVGPEGWGLFFFLLLAAL